jgi:aarF domain-containing kinase
MSSSLGYDWCQSFASFTSVPFAAASLGQVHEAVLAAHASPTGNEARVAVKVQFPDVRKSIDSDLGYLTTLLSGIGGVLPKGAFLGKTIEVRLRKHVQDVH